jgi:hypothetical protein
MAVQAAWIRAYKFLYDASGDRGLRHIAWGALSLAEKFLPTILPPVSKTDDANDNILSDACL